MDNKATKPLHDGLDDGWSIQVYSRDRRLVCSLYPSHGWVFMIGIVLGFLVTAVGFRGQPVAQSSLPNPSPTEAPLRLE